MLLRARLNNLAVRIPKLAALFTRLQAAVYIASRGRLWRRKSGAPVMVIETVGRRSGQVRRSPVICVFWEGDPVVMPARAGTDRVPAWWLNLLSAGEATVVIDGERRRVAPRVVEGAEYRRLWDHFGEVLPDIEDYRRFTARELPIAVLERTDAPGRHEPFTR